MGIMVLLEVAAKPESVDEMSEFLAARLPETREFPGCESITAYLNDDGRTIVLVEHWDTQASYEKYTAWRQETGVLDTLASMLAGPPSIRYFDALDA